MRAAVRLQVGQLGECLTTSRVLALVRLLTRVCPVKWGYGISFWLITTSYSLMVDSALRFWEEIEREHFKYKELEFKTDILIEESMNRFVHGMDHCTVGYLRETLADETPYKYQHPACDRASPVLPRALQNIPHLINESNLSCLLCPTIWKETPTVHVYLSYTWRI